MVTQYISNWHSSIVKVSNLIYFSTSPMYFGIAWYQASLFEVWFGVLWLILFLINGNGDDFGDNASIDAYQSLSFLFNAKPFKTDCIRFHWVYSVENVVSTPIDTKVGAGWCGKSLTSFLHNLPHNHIPVPFHFWSPLLCTSPAFLRHLCLRPTPVMLVQEASDSSVTPLSWHLLALPPPCHGLSQTLNALSVWPP